MTNDFQFTEGSGKTGAAIDIGSGRLAPLVIATEQDGTNTGLAAKLGSLTETAPATDTASSGLNGRLQRIAQNITAFKTALLAILPAALGTGGGLKIDGSGTALPVSVASVPLPSGAATEATLAGVLTTSDFDTKIGSLTETAPASDTASAGINGRLQRIAQRLTTLIGSTIAVSGTFWQATQPVSIADGINVTFGAKADAKSTATDTTAITAMSVWKQISASVQTIAAWTGSAISVATHAVTQSGTWTVQPGNTANTTAWKVDGSAVTQPVSIASVPSHAVTNAGTFAVQAASAGDVAHDGVDSGNPVKVGGKATSAEPTAVSASGDRANFITDMVGKQITLPYANPENFVNGTTGAITDTTSTSTIAAQGAGIRTYITQITVTNSHATVGTFVKILDGASIIYEAYAAEAAGGFTASFPTPLRGSGNTAVNTQCVTTGANVIASISGYKGI
jgi:hypothetical protein